MFSLKQVLYFIPLLSGLFFANISVSLEIGDTLKPLYIESTPITFDYKPTGERQLILIYPVAISTRSSGKFNHRVIKEGFCPKSIVDMKNRAWYAPLAFTVNEMNERFARSPNRDCTVTADFDGVANKHWALEKGPTTIVTDGKGSVIYFNYGKLDEQQQQTVIALLHNKKSSVK